MSNHAIIKTRHGNKYTGTFKSFNKKEGNILVENVVQIVGNKKIVSRKVLRRRECIERNNKHINDHKASNAQYKKDNTSATDNKVFSFIVFKLKYLTYLEIDGIEMKHFLEEDRGSGKKNDGKRHCSDDSSESESLEEESNKIIRDRLVESREFQDICEEVNRVFEEGPGSYSKDTNNNFHREVSKEKKFKANKNNEARNVTSGFRSTNNNNNRPLKNHSERDINDAFHKIKDESDYKSKKTKKPFDFHDGNKKQNKSKERSYHSNSNTEKSALMEEEGLQVNVPKGDFDFNTTESINKIEESIKKTQSINKIADSGKEKRKSFFDDFR